MATYTSTDTRAGGLVPGAGASRSIVTYAKSYAITTAMIDNTNDSIELCYVPAGAVIVGITLGATDMDTNGTPTLKFDVGDSGDQDRLIVATTIGQTGGTTTTLATTGIGYKYTTATKIVAYVNAVSATGAAGTLYFVLEYFVDPGFTLASTVT